MYSIKCLLVLIAGAAAACGASGPSIQYFRSDAGMASQAGKLPSELAGQPHWRMPVPAGQSTPILANGSVFLTTYNAPAQELATVALNLTNGALRWKHVVPAPRIEPFHPQMGSGAPSTPACDGERLYTFYGSYGLICYDLDGKILWEHRMGPFRDEYGAGSSPVLVDGKVVLNQDHDIDNFLIALGKVTGKTLWKTTRPDAVRSYSTPTVWTHQGRKELLVAGSLELAAYSPDNGEKLWSKHGLARIVIPAPVVSGDTIVMAAWAPGGDNTARITFPAWDAALERWDKNKDGALTRAEIDDSNVLERFFRMDLDQNSRLDQKEWERHAEIFQKAENCVMALRPSANRGELSEGDVLWKYRRGVPYVPSPLLDQGRFWMVKDGGIVTTIEVASGKVLHEERLPAVGSYLASPVGGDGKIYFASEQGVVSVVANEPEWRVLSSHPFREKIYATPAIAGDHLIIRTDKAVYCF